MRKIVYYVAMSLDGYISGTNDDISQFKTEGNGVKQYLKDLEEFDTVIMGRKTYEFGYNYGLQPGQKAYPHLRHIIFSNTLKLENPEDGVEICELHPQTIIRLKEEQGSPIYLCGGGRFAQWLLENEMIDQVKVKLNPFLTGTGVRLFGDSKKRVALKLLKSKVYEEGLQIMTYEVEY